MMIPQTGVEPATLCLSGGVEVCALYSHSTSRWKEAEELPTTLEETQVMVWL